jgi:hypothetical protein
MKLLAASVACAAALVVSAPLHAQQPWLTAESRLLSDDQPRTALHVDTELGRYFSPAITLAVTAGGTRITADGGIAAAGITDATGYAGLAATLSVPAARLGIRAGARALLGVPESAGTSAAVLGSVVARIDAGADVGVRLRAERDRYSWTVASLDTLVLVNTLELALDRAGAPGWAGEAVARRETYGDGNTVSTAFAWALAPLSRSMTHSLRVGYAAGWQDAEESRWVPVRAERGPGVPTIDGRYVPYYTPHNVVTHSGLADAAVAIGAAWLRLDGSVGLRAHEDATMFVPGQAPAAPVRVVARRSFTPFRAGAALSAPADDRTWVTLGADFNRLAHYRVGTVRLALARSL